jgi:AmmeMemoRadiSam system protein A
MFQMEERAMHTSNLTPQQRETLLDVARRSIRHGLDLGSALRIQGADYEPPLSQVRASFVTLHHNGMLRGCIGHLEAILPLIEDVAENAFSAAFRDPRFPLLTAEEYPGLELHISALTPAEPLAFESEEDLLQRMRPFKDGLILAEGVRQGTFLPSVWEQLPDPRDFLRHLKIKAGLPEDYWSPSIKIYRYETESFS